MDHIIEPAVIGPGLLPARPAPKYLAKRSASGEWLELVDVSDWTAEMWANGCDYVFSAEQMMDYGRKCAEQAFAEGYERRHMEVLGALV